MFFSFVLQARCLMILGFGLVLQGVVAGMEGAEGVAVPEGEGACADVRIVLRQACMGTVFTVQAYPPADMNAVTARGICRQALAEAAEWERVLSAKDVTSQLSQFNRAAAGEPIAVSPRLFQALKEALEYARLSHGVFDPTLGLCMRLWRRAKNRGELPEEGDLAFARQHSGWHLLRLEGRQAVKRSEHMLLDLGAIGKGIALDYMAAYLHSHGIHAFCLDDTSDILAGEPPPGKKGWVVKLETGPGQFQAYTLRGGAISTAGYRFQSLVIGGRRFSHILDPATGLGMTALRQASVLAPTATMADALATAACVAGRDVWTGYAGHLPGVRLLALIEQKAGEAAK